MYRRAGVQCLLRKCVSACPVDRQCRHLQGMQKLERASEHAQVPPLVAAADNVKGPWPRAFRELGQKKDKPDGVPCDGAQVHGTGGALQRGAGGPEQEQVVHQRHRAERRHKRKAAASARRAAAARAHARREEPGHGHQVASIPCWVAVKRIVHACGLRVRHENADAQKVVRECRALGVIRGRKRQHGGRRQQVPADDHGIGMHGSMLAKVRGAAHQKHGAPKHVRPDVHSFSVHTEKAPAAVRLAQVCVHLDAVFCVRRTGPQAGRVLHTVPGDFAVRCICIRSRDSMLITTAQLCCCIPGWVPRCADSLRGLTGHRESKTLLSPIPFACVMSLILCMCVSCTLFVSC